ERAVTTDGSGNFSLLALPPATYIVQATFTGYGAPLKTVVVNLGQKVPLNFEMKPGGGLKEELKVTAEAPIVNTTKNEISTVVSETQVRSYPLLNRDYTDLASLAPGVKQAPSGQFDPTKHKGIYTPFTTGGSAGRNLNISIDGADNNDNVVGFFVGGVSAEAIQEFEIIQDEYKAEYGRSLGGVVNVITKSGTNDFGGSVFGTYRNDSFRAKTYSEDLAGIDKAKSDREQYGFSVGGPILKDKLFYFFAAEKQNEASPVALNSALTRFSTGLDPNFPIAISANGTTVSHDFERHEYDARVDWNISKNMTLWARWFRDDNTFKNDQGASLTNPENQGDSTNLVHQAVVNWQWNIRGNMINELKFNRITFTNGVTSRATDPVSSILTLDYDSFELGRNVNTPQKTVQNKYQMRDDFTWILGRHSLKGGLEVIRVDMLPSFLGPSTNPSVQITFNAGVTPNGSIANGDTNMNGTNDGVEAISDLTFVNPGFIPGTRYEQYGIYAQDDWEMNDRWRFNIGLRVDSDQNVFRDATTGVNQDFYDCIADPRNNAKCGRPAGLQIDPNVKFPSFNNTTPKDPTDISPRLGFVYRVNGEDKDVLRGSWGLFYDKFLDNLGIFMRQNLSPFFSPALPVLAGVDPTDPATLTSNQLLAGTVVDPRLPPLPVDFTLANWLNPAVTDPNGFSLRDWFNQLGSILGRATFNDGVFMPGPDWKTPYTSAFSIGWGHVFSPRLALDTNLVYRRGFHQLYRQSWRGRNSGRYSPFPVDLDPNGNPIVDPNSGRAPGSSFEGLADFFTTDGKSQYISLQTGVKARYPSFEFGINLNLSQALGTQDNAGTGPTDGGPVDIFEAGNIRFTGGNINSEWGRISGDQFLYVNAYGIYHFPLQFQAAGSLTYGTRTAYQGFAGVDLNGDGFNSQNEYAGSRGSGVGDDYFTLNLRASKMFDTGKGTKVEVFAEAFNLLDRVNHGLFVFHQQLTVDKNGSIVRNPSYGKPTGDTLVDPRTVQIGTRFTF
ncbi:MAG: TonB-dependent receptor, partial [Acidobacteria bacterium]|nr:TonB-dependent receptor [Acidobacteriota bacterium]